MISTLDQFEFVAILPNREPMNAKEYFYFLVAREGEDVAFTVLSNHLAQAIKSYYQAEDVTGLREKIFTKNDR